MKIKTLPNGNMDLEGIEFVSQTGFHVTIGPHSVSHDGTYHHLLTWMEDGGNGLEPQRTRFEYKSIVSCFQNKEWRVKETGKPVKIMKRVKF